MTVSAVIVRQYYNAIFRHPPDDAVVLSYSLYSNEASVLNSMLNAAQLTTAPVVRLYQAAFDRLPDPKGLTAWVNAYTAGVLTIEDVANQFSQSAEFLLRYPPDMNNAQFIAALYQNVLQRDPDPAGYQFWLNSGLTRGQILGYFAQSIEFKVLVNTPTHTFLTNIAQTPIASQEDASLFTGNLFELGGAPSTKYNLTINPDIYGDSHLGTQQDFIAHPGTFTNFDLLTGGYNTSDSLTINDASAGGFTNPGGALVKSIENITFNLAAAGTVNTSNSGSSTSFSGVRKITVNSVPSAGANNLVVSAEGTTSIIINSTQRQPQQQLTAVRQ